MPEYKFHYFDGRAKGEVARLMFLYGDVQYEDIRYSFEEWPEVRKKLPLKKVPVLEVDGHVINQSGAVFRYLAKQVGLYGKDDLECAQIDAIFDSSEEFWTFLHTIYNEKDPEKKAAAVKNCSEVLIPPYLDFFERELHKGTNGFFVGGRMTLADIRTVNDVQWPLVFGCNYDLTKYPQLKALVDTINTHPKFKAWIEKYPVTMF